MNRLALARAAVDPPSDNPGATQTKGRRRATPGRGPGRGHGQRGSEPAAAENADARLIQAAGGAANRGFEELTRYLPTETVTFYLAALGVAGATGGDFTGRWIVFFTFLAATPLMIFVDWKIQRRQSGEVIDSEARTNLRFNLVAATIAFAAWAFALPATAFADFAWYDAKYAGFIALVIPYVITKGEGLVLPVRKPTAA